MVSSIHLLPGVSAQGAARASATPPGGGLHPNPEYLRADESFSALEGVVKSDEKRGGGFADFLTGRGECCDRR